MLVRYKRGVKDNSKIQSEIAGEQRRDGSETKLG